MPASHTPLTPKTSEALHASPTGFGGDLPYELGTATRPVAFQDHPFSIRAVALSPLAGRLASMKAAHERIPDTADAAGALRAGRAPEMVVGAVRGHAGFQL